MKAALGFTIGVICILVIIDLIVYYAPPEYFRGMIEFWGLPGVVTSGAVSPRGSSNIRMESEQIMIRLGQDTFIVDAMYHLINPGETTTEKVGFPVEGSARDFTFIRFDAWVDGNEMRLSEEDDSGMVHSVADWITSRLAGRPSTPMTGPVRKDRRQIEDYRWLVGDVKFNGRHKATLRARYESRYVPYVECSKAIFILAALPQWKDRIGSVILTIDCTEVGGAKNVTAGCVLGMAPGPERVGDNLLKFELREVELPPHAALIIELPGILQFKIGS